MTEWAARTYGAHPETVRRTYSLPLLHVLFDAWWWTNCAPPPEPQKSLDGETPLVPLEDLMGAINKK